jgi:DNA polymerase-3 subunit alpha
MESLFHDLPESLLNTIEISQRCSFKPEIKNPILPVFIKGAENTEEDLLRKISNEGLEKRVMQTLKMKKIENDEESNQLRVNIIRD